MSEVEWGWRDDIEDVLEGLSGCALLILARWGPTDPRFEPVMVTLGVLNALLDESEPRPST